MLPLLLATTCLLAGAQGLPVKNCTQMRLAQAYPHVAASVQGGVRGCLTMGLNEQYSITACALPAPPVCIKLKYTPAFTRILLQYCTQNSHATYQTTRLLSTPTPPRVSTRLRTRVRLVYLFVHVYSRTTLKLCACVNYTHFQASPLPRATAPSLW